MKDISVKDCNKSQKSSHEEAHSVVVQIRPTKAELKLAIEKSIKKNNAALKVLAKR